LNFNKITNLTKPKVLHSIRQWYSTKHGIHDTVTTFVFEVTYNVSSGTLNPTVPIPVTTHYDDLCLIVCDRLRFQWTKLFKSSETSRFYL